MSTVKVLPEKYNWYFSETSDSYLSSWRFHFATKFHKKLQLTKFQKRYKRYSYWPLFIVIVHLQYSIVIGHPAELGVADPYCHSFTQGLDPVGKNIFAW